MGWGCRELVIDFGHKWLCSKLNCCQHNPGGKQGPILPRKRVQRSSWNGWEKPLGPCRTPMLDAAACFPLRESPAPIQEEVEDGDQPTELPHMPPAAPPPVAAASVPAHSSPTPPSAEEPVLEPPDLEPRETMAGLPCALMPLLQLILPPLPCPAAAAAAPETCPASPLSF